MKDKGITIVRVLKLSLKFQPFEVMVTGEKKLEFRKPSKWIISRLFWPDGRIKDYDLIEFTNGYGATLPRFVCEYKGFKFSDHGIHTEPYSNGLFLGFLEAGTIQIELGKIIQIKNYKLK